MKSGFVTLVGRPNVGKSTLLNALVGEKVSIVSNTAQTTRFPIRGVLHRPGVQAVFVDTPGIHKPRTRLGEQLNAVASSSLDVDVICFVVDVTAPIGTGDRFVAARLDPERTILVLNKCDHARPEVIARQLSVAAEWGFAEYVPVSARTCDGLDRLIDVVTARLPEGPAYYPEDQVTDLPDPVWVAELVREQLLWVTRDELPHSIATRVTEWQGRRIRCEIVVERESQKGIVIGKGGDVLKKVGTAARRQLPAGTFLELRVRVDKDWQRRPDAFERIAAALDTDSLGDAE